MAKKMPPQFAKQAKPVDGNAPASAKVAKGRMSPAQAAKLKHSADAVLGKNDTAYHNC